MNTLLDQNRTRNASSGLTLVEVLVVIAIVAILAGLMLPASTHNHAKAFRIKCASNLKEVGLAFRLWEGDGDRFPMAAFTNKTGGPLYSDSADMFRYFQVMSNELSDPQVLICPADIKRNPATNFTSDFSSVHISYFIGLDSDEMYPQAFLAGDSNITNGVQPLAGLVELLTNQYAAWTQERHNKFGNVVLADGSVQQWSSLALNMALKHTGLATNRLLFPPEMPK